MKSPAKTPRETLSRTAARAASTEPAASNSQANASGAEPSKPVIPAPEGDASRPSPGGGTGATINLLNLGSHGLAVLFSNLMAGLEQLPGSPRATELVTSLGKLRDSTEDLINGVDDRHAVAPVAPVEPESPIDVGAFTKDLVEAVPDWLGDMRQRLNDQLDRMADERGTTREAITSFARGFLSGVDAAKGAVTVNAPAPAEDEEPDDGKIAVRVIGPQAGRRRLGRQFTDAPQDLRVSFDELEVLRADPTLEVRRRD